MTEAQIFFYQGTLESLVAQLRNKHRGIIFNDPSMPNDNMVHGSTSNGTDLYHVVSAVSRTIKDGVVIYCDESFNNLIAKGAVKVTDGIAEEEGPILRIGQESLGGFQSDSLRGILNELRGISQLGGSQGDENAVQVAGVDGAFKDSGVISNLQPNFYEIKYPTDSVEFFAKDVSETVPFLSQSSTAASIGNSSKETGTEKLTLWNGVAQFSVPVEHEPAITDNQSLLLGQAKALISQDSLGNGVVSGMVLSLGTSTSKFNLSSGVYKKIDVGLVDYPGVVDQTLSNLTSAEGTYIGIVVSTNSIIQQATPFTHSQRRSIIPIGFVSHINNSTINEITNLPDIASNPLSQLNDLMDSLGRFNEKGNKVTPNGANLKINKSEGVIYQRGLNFSSDSSNPHSKVMPSLTAPTNLRMRLSNGVESEDIGSLITSYEPSPGVLVDLTSYKYGVFRVVLFPSNLIRIQYPQFLYSTIEEAQVAIFKEQYVTESDMAQNGLLRGYIVVRGDVTDLSDVSRCKFLEADKFGQFPTTGSPVLRTDLQIAYQNSAEGGIITDPVTGSFKLKRGSYLDTDYVFEVRNGNGVTTAFIKGNGENSFGGGDQNLSQTLTNGKDGDLLGITNLGKLDSGQLTVQRSGVWQVSSPTGHGTENPTVTGLVVNTTANGSYTPTELTTTWDDVIYTVYRLGNTPWYLARIGWFWLVTDNIVSPEWATAIAYGAGGLPNPIGYYLKLTTETSETIFVTVSGSDSTIDSIVSEGSIYCDSMIKVKSGINITSKSLLVYDERVGSEAFRISLNGGNTEFAYSPENGVAALEGINFDQVGDHSDNILVKGVADSPWYHATKMSVLPEGTNPLYIDANAFVNVHGVKLFQFGNSSPAVGVGNDTGTKNERRIVTNGLCTVRVYNRSDLAGSLERGCKVFLDGEIGESYGYGKVYGIDGVNQPFTGTKNSPYMGWVTEDTVSVPVNGYVIARVYLEIDTSGQYSSGDTEGFIQLSDGSGGFKNTLVAIKSDGSWTLSLDFDHFNGIIKAGGSVGIDINSDNLSSDTFNVKDYQTKIFNVQGGGSHDYYGCAELPQATTARIAALGDKAVITKEYLAMLSRGDLMYLGEDGKPVRLAIGSSGQVLSVDTGTISPKWVNPSGGGSTNRSIISFGYGGYYNANTLFAYSDTSTTSGTRNTKFIAIRDCKITGFSWAHSGSVGLGKHKIFLNGWNWIDVSPEGVSTIGFFVLETPITVGAGYTIELVFTGSVETMTSASIELTY